MQYRRTQPHESIIDTQEFLALSSFFNYQLSGEPVNWHGILNLMLSRHLPDDDETVLLKALEYLGHAYGGQKRRLGPLAVLHPIRAAALLAKAWKEATVDSLLLTLLHDKDEDITEDGYDADAWRQLQDTFSQLLELIGPQRAAVLQERLVFLTKTPGQKYYDYLGHLLAEARRRPGLAAIKLADRLDNTLDLRIDLQDFTEHSRCYQILFDIIFLKSYKGFVSERPHPIARKINGAMRLYQLYKNAVFLSLLRHERVELDEVGHKLFFSLAVASIREAQTILLHIFAYHLRSADQQRELLVDVMEYSHAGGFNRISNNGGHRLDGLFCRYFVFEDKLAKKKGLQTLYDDKNLMGQAALGFMIIFANFINDGDYRIHGISAGGIEPDVGAQ